MKDIKSLEEINNLPHKIQYLYMKSFMNQPIGMSFYEECIEEHPEYFQEEIKRRDKWNSIPQEVKDAYYNELNAKEAEINEGIPHLGKGILYYCEHPDEYDEYDREYKKREPKRKKMRKKIHDKYFEKYGVEYYEY